MSVVHVHVTQKREFFAHHMLLHAAGIDLEHAATIQLGSFNRALSSMVLSSLAVEALVNAVGSRVVPDWSTWERLKPFEKLNSLVTTLQIHRDNRKAPWPALRFLSGFRNDIAHPKPERLQTARTVPHSAVDRQFRNRPRSKLERDITVGNAQRALAAVQSLKGILADALPVEKRFGIYADMSSGRASLTDVA
jgi:hypothetical protein